MKFILIERQMQDDMIEFIGIIFPNNFAHVKVYENFLITVGQHRVGVFDCKVVSAGDYSPVNQKFNGRSGTINITCHPKTKEVFEFLDYQCIYDSKSNPFNINTPPYK